MYLKKLSEKYNIDQLQSEVKDVMKLHSLQDNQISLNHRPGFEESCWTDGCGSPFMRKSDNSDDVVDNRKQNNEPRFIDTDFTVINSELQGTLLEEIYKFYSSKMKIGRYRIAALNPKTCYGWHYDLEKRIHIPVFTNNGSFIITDDGKATHLPATGEAWMFTANSGYHTAMNASYTEVRIHLLLNVWE